MLADELYEEIKTALRYFGLRFSEMNRVLVVPRDGVIEFHHDGRTVIVRTAPNV